MDRGWRCEWRRRRPGGDRSPQERRRPRRLCRGGDADHHRRARERARQGRRGLHLRTDDADVAGNAGGDRAQAAGQPVPHRIQAAPAAWTHAAVRRGCA